MIRPLAAAFALALAAALAVQAPAFAASGTAIFAGGCFWCVESDFDHVDGVTDTVSGYIGGTNENPTYDNYAAAGHREAVKITFDPARVSYEELVDIFFHSVDVTDAGGQFCDRGHAYTTAIYTLDEEQAAIARKVKVRVEKELGQKIVTPIIAAPRFWKAEDYHQNYYRSQERVLTRFGYITRARAYKAYREGCGRDARLRQLWGASAHRGIGGH